MPDLFRSVVPIVGTPTVHSWRPVVSLSCSCGNGRPLLISSPEQVEVCVGCGAGYRLHDLHYDSTKGPGAVMRFHRLTPKAQA